MYQLPEQKTYSQEKTETVKLGGLNKSNNIIRINRLKEVEFCRIAEQIRLKESRAENHRVI